MLTYSVGAIALASAVLASPTPQPEASIDTSVHCGQWDTVTAGNYELLLDQWGISGASGSQCAHIASMSGSTIAWTTNWTWTGGNGVKTFTDIQLNAGIGKQLSAIKSMQVGVSICRLLVFKINSDLRRRGTGPTRCRAVQSPTLLSICSRRRPRRART